MKFWICRCKRFSTVRVSIAPTPPRRSMSATKVFGVLCVVLVLLVSFALAEEDSVWPQGPRDKRTIGTVLRNVADLFGYDVQRRPTAIPPSMAPAPGGMSGTMPAAGR